jgi:hypothetical protein
MWKQITVHCHQQLLGVLEDGKVQLKLRDWIMTKYWKNSYCQKLGIRAYHLDHILEMGVPFKHTMF